MGYDFGITSSEFSKSLMRNCSRIIKRGNPDSSIQDKVLFCADDPSTRIKEIEDRFYTSKETVIDPSIVLSKAYNKVTALGSATALICVINKKELSCANIGDSKFLLIRFDNDDNPFIILQSTPQHHVFNTPYQLARIPLSSQLEYELRQNFVHHDKIVEIIEEYQTLGKLIKYN